MCCGGWPASDKQPERSDAEYKPQEQRPPDSIEAYRWVTAHVSPSVGADMTVGTSTEHVPLVTHARIKKRSRRHDAARHDGSRSARVIGRSPPSGTVSPPPV